MSTDAHGWESEESDTNGGLGIASGSPLDLSLNDSSVIPDAARLSVGSSTSNQASHKKDGGLRKAFMGKKPKKCHFKVFNPAKDYPQTHKYTPHIHGGKPVPETGSNKKGEKRASCPHCRMTFTTLVDAEMIQKHIDMHKYTK